MKFNTITYCLFILLVMQSCTKDTVDYDDSLVSSIETFAEVGGRCDWNSNTDRIVFDTQNGDRWDTYICNPDKSGMFNLTEDMTGKTYGNQTVQKWQHRGQPVFHPSGEYIVFQVMNKYASSSIKTSELLSLGVNNDLWFMNADGSNKQKLTNNPEGYSALHAHFSHDGKQLLWAEQYDGSSDVSNFGAWRMKLADIDIDSAGNALLTNIQSLQPGGEKWYETHSFSDDDTKIFFSGNLTTDKKANDIYSYDLNTKELVNITNSPATWEEMYNINPVHPDQYSYISSEFFDWNNKFGWATLRTELYINDKGTKKQITYYNQKKKDNTKRLTKGHFFIGDHCWGPDGKTFLAVVAEAKIGSAESEIIKINLK